MHRLLIALSLTAACTATVRTAGPPPAEPAPPPPPPPVVHDHREPAPPPPAPPPPAAEPGQHAAFGAAIHDLRVARKLLEHSTGTVMDVKFDDRAAVREIDEAIRAIHEAKLDVGAANEEPAVDMNKAYKDRVLEARVKLGDAANNLAQKEDDREARQHIQQASNHINAARKLIEDAMHEANRRDGH